MAIKAYGPKQRVLHGWSHFEHLKRVVFPLCKAFHRRDNQICSGISSTRETDFL